MLGELRGLCVAYPHLNTREDERQPTCSKASLDDGLIVGQNVAVLPKPHVGESVSLLPPSFGKNTAPSCFHRRDDRQGRRSRRRGDGGRGCCDRAGCRIRGERR